MKLKWQKYVFSICLALGVLVGITTGFPYAIGVAAVIGLVLHFVAGYFLPPKD